MFGIQCIVQLPLENVLPSLTPGVIRVTPGVEHGDESRTYLQASPNDVVQMMLFRMSCKQKHQTKPSKEKSSSYSSCR
eukprot:1187713-Prorocentrum_minimum.AAC.5